MNMRLVILLSHISFLLLLLLPLPGAAEEEQAKISVTFKAADSFKDARYKKQIRESLMVGIITDIIEDEFHLLKPLRITFGGRKGPVFNQADNEILIPYRFFGELERRFKEGEYEESGVSIYAATIDAFVHMLFHEISHALIANYKLPVAGREEDFVNGLATVLLLEYFDEGDETAISAADLFDIKNDQDQNAEEKDYWDRHGLDKQRQFKTLCYVYGKNPKKFASLPKDYDIPKKKMAGCVAEYNKLAFRWGQILSPYIKGLKKPKLNKTPPR